MRYFLLTGNINEIDPCEAGIEVQLPIIILYLGHFNAPKSVLCVENSAVGQQITLKKSVMS